MKTIAACALLLAALPLSAAELYRWVDDKGNVEWRDTPPPSTAKKVEKRNMGGNTIETSTLPYSVQQAVKNHPVTLWVFDCGAPCNDARAHLAKRSVPYTERNSQRESDAMKKVTGSLEVPVLIVGSRQLKGYLEGDWDAALDAAGYPRSGIPGVKTQVKSDATKDAKAAPAADSKAGAKGADAKAPASSAAR